MDLYRHCVCPGSYLKYAFSFYNVHIITHGLCSYNTRLPNDDVTAIQASCWRRGEFPTYARLPRGRMTDTNLRHLIQGLYSLSWQASYRKILWNFAAKCLALLITLTTDRHFGSCAALSDIFWRYDDYNIQPRAFETSRDFAVRRLTTQRIKTQRELHTCKTLTHICMFCQKITSWQGIIFMMEKAFVALIVYRLDSCSDLTNPNNSK